tara:strand:- start:660 stop:770 length:111 start_codon:yes stop_codon:yes gene_type:complete
LDAATVKAEEHQRNSTEKYIHLLEQELAVIGQFLEI